MKRRSQTTDREEPIIKRAAKPLTVLPSKGLPDIALGVQSFMPLFIRWRDANALSEIEPSRPLPSSSKHGPEASIDAELVQAGADSGRAFVGYKLQ